MTVTLNQPYVLQGSSHSALLFRQAIGTLLGPNGGVVSTGDFALSQLSTPNMSVNVAAGQIWVPGSSGQALYYTRSDTTVNLAIGAANVSNPRVDTIVVQIEDAAYAGSNNDAILTVVPGAAAAGANITPGSGGYLAGVGTVPSNALVIGYVLVPAGATSIVTADLEYVVGPNSLNTSLAYYSGGWSPLTLASGVTTGSSWGGLTASARLEPGNVVRLKGILFNNGSAISAGSTIATLPSAFWAPFVSDFLVYPGGGANAAVKITPAGVIATVTSSFAGGDSIYLNGVTYTLS